MSVQTIAYTRQQSIRKKQPAPVRRNPTRVRLATYAFGGSVVPANLKWTFPVLSATMAMTPASL